MNGWKATHPKSNIDPKMKTVLVTGAAGFIGKHICLALKRWGDVEVLEFLSSNSIEEIPGMISRADVVIHLAGVNRPKTEEEFESGNAGFTSMLCEGLKSDGRNLPLIVSSTIQAEKDNPYGQSKLGAEKAAIAYHEECGAPVYLYRLPNVFGKWSRPMYNTVVATFCHNISRGLPVTVNAPEALLQLTYIDDLVAEFVAVAMGEKSPAQPYPEVSPIHTILLQELCDTIQSFEDNRRLSKLADLGDPLTKALYSTYLSFLPKEDFGYPVDLKTDDRGWLFELVKSDAAGQIFVSKTKPGITRGHHYHDSKVEKFCVIKGKGTIRFRHVLENEILSYPVDDETIQVVDIPPGLTHSIENTGEEEMITLFWAKEIFDPNHPDTFFVKVDESV